eukprot:6213193-Pleurochrysis_carterae.AAC.6
MQLNDFRPHCASPSAFVETLLPSPVSSYFLLASTSTHLRPASFCVFLEFPSHPQLCRTHSAPRYVPALCTPVFPVLQRPRVRALFAADAQVRRCRLVARRPEYPRDEPRAAGQLSAPVLLQEVPGSVFADCCMRGREETRALTKLSILSLSICNCLLTVRNVHCKKTV